jgi:DNA-binding LacI/PurR family transcriptional regulator
MPTQKDVARIANISIATVSRYLNKKGYISPAVKIRIKDAIQKLQYRPNLVARSLKINKTSTIGMIFPDIENPFFITFIRSAEHVLQGRGYNVLLCNTENRIEKEEASIEALRGRLIDGYIVIPTVSQDYQFFPLLESEKVIFFDRRIQNPGSISLTLDNRHGIRTAVSYLVSLGHRRIGCINVGMEIYTGSERFEGYKEALSSNGIKLDLSIVRNAGLSIENAYRETRQLLQIKTPPTAIIPMSSLTTIGALKAIRSLGLRIPADISVIGFDDFVYADLLNPPLTTIAQPAEEFGRVAADLLLRLIANKRISEHHVELEPTLMKRESCKHL